VKSARTAKFTCRFILPAILAIAMLSCDPLSVVLAPPDWIQGTWQSDTSQADAEYVRWVFTTDNAVYEYHDPANDEHVTIDLGSHFAGRSVTDDSEDGQNQYKIMIELKQHEFYQEIDQEDVVTDPAALGYRVGAAGRSWVWELAKQ
jgi:hypothetical protein